MNKVSSIVNAIQEANEKGLLVHPEGLTGYSGNKLMGTLQRIAQLRTSSQQCYLEVGVFQGLTLLSVASAINKESIAFGIDNFAFFDPEGQNLSIVEQRRKNLKLENAQLINMDYEDAFDNLKKYIGDRKIGLYFVDGPHDYRSQLVCLLIAKPFLADDAVIVIDDSNYRHVRQANNDFLKSHPEYALLLEAYTPCHPMNMNKEERSKVEKGWWNGVNILIRDMEKLIQTYPHTYRSRALYENEHIVHATRYPETAIFGCNIAEGFGSNNYKQVLRNNLRLKKTIKKINEPHRYQSMNTYSEKLPEFHLTV